MLKAGIWALPSFSPWDLRSGLEMGSSCTHLGDRPFPHPARPGEKTPGSSFPSPDWSWEQGPGGAKNSGTLSPGTAVEWGSWSGHRGDYNSIHMRDSVLFVREPLPCSTRPTPEQRHVPRAVSALSLPESPAAEILGRTGTRDSTLPEPPSSARLGPVRWPRVTHVAT